MQKLLPLLLALLVTTAGGSACKETASQRRGVVPSTEADEEAIRELLRMNDDAMTSGDPDGVAALYTNDAVEMGQNRPAIFGKSAIHALEERYLRANHAEVRTTVDTILVSGDLAVVRAGFTVSRTPKSGGDTTTLVAKSLRVCHRQADGSWKIGILMWSSDAPLGSN